MNSWKLGGVQIKVHPLFWLVTIAAALTGQFLELMTLFTLVVIHELGHVFAAKAVGWRVTSMELLPFGGVAKVDEWGSTQAKDEVIVALAGPFLNGVMIGIGYVFLWTGLWDRQWTEFFISGNAIIACFNLLPIWPLDGGKILQAILSQFCSYYKTIYLSLQWSFFSLILLLALSFWFPFQLNLIVIGVYLLIENRIAWKRAQYQFIRFLLNKKEKDLSLSPVAPVLTYSVNPTVSIGEAVKLLKRGAIHRFQVIDHQQNIVAVLSEDMILHAFFKKNPRNPISELLPIG